jgi:hypothetical protein
MMSPGGQVNSTGIPPNQKSKKACYELISLHHITFPI